MQIRWIDTSQPMPLTGSCNGKKINIFDIDRLIPQTNINIIPGERKLIDVAVKIINEDECYGFCNENYLFSQGDLLRYPKWKLNKGNYLIKVDISSSTGGICEIFRIINNGRDGDFKLKQALPEERKKLFSAN